MLNHTHEEVEPHVLQAIRELGLGTFVSDDGVQRLSVSKGGEFNSDTVLYFATYNYSYLQYKFTFTEQEVEGVTA